MMYFTWNLILAIAWVALSGEFSFPNMVVGFLLGYIALRLAFGRSPAFRNYFLRVPLAVRFVWLFVWDLIKSNARVAYDVVTPRFQATPAVVGVPLTLTTDREITILANMITLTPGTLSLDVSDDKKVLYIHAMYFTDEESMRAEVRELEERVRTLFGTGPVCLEKEERNA